MSLDQDLTGADRVAILAALGIPLELVEAAEKGELSMYSRGDHRPSPLLATAVSRYITASPNLQGASLKTYPPVLHESVEYMHRAWTGTPEETWTLDRVKARDIADFSARSKRDGTPRAARSHNRDLAIIRSLFNWLVEEGDMEYSPGQRAKRQREPKQAPVALSPQEQQEVLELARQTKNGIRNHTIVHLILNTGLRASEVCALKWASIDLTGGRLTVLQGKGAKDRTVPLLPTVVDSLRYWLSVRRHQVAAPGFHDYVFINDAGPAWGRSMTVDGLEDMIGRLMCKLNKPKGQVVHVLRHSFAVNLLHKGMHPVYIRTLLGHESLETTRIYLRHGDKEVLDEMARQFPQGIVVPHSQLEILDAEYDALVQMIYE